jgi:dihydrofolate reductase
MKRLILQMQMSVDGFVSGADPGLDWTLWDWGPDCPWDEALKRRFNETLARVDTILLSGPMATPYLIHWTQIASQCAGDPDFAFAERVVAAHKRIISQSLDAIHQPRTTIGRGSLHDEVTTLKQQPGGDIICFGGVSFGASLLEASLVDELQFYVNPYAIRSGRSIFRHPRPLQCIDATAYACGIVVQRYRPA